MENNYTVTGFNLYLWFTSKQIQGFASTDPKTVYFMPDNEKIQNVNDVEDWFIRKAEQIKSERQQIIIDNVCNR